MGWSKGTQVAIKLGFSLTTPLSSWFRQGYLRVVIATGTFHDRCWGSIG